MRRLLWVLLALLLLILAFVAAAVFWRTDLAEIAARSWLRQQGFAEGRLDVTALTTRRLVVRDIDLGAGAPRAARLAVSYSPQQLLAGRVARVAVDDPVLHVDLDAPQPLGRVQRLLPGEAGAGPRDGDRPVPEVVLRRARIAVTSAHGDVDLHFDGRLTPTDEDLHALMRGRAEAGHTTAEVSLDLRGLATRPHLRLEATGETALAGIPWPAAWTPIPNEGRAAFDLSYDGALPTSVPAPQAALATSATGRLSLQVRDAALAPYARGVDADLDLGLRTADDRLVLRLRAPASVTAAAIDAEALASRGLAPPLAGVLAGIRRISLAPWTEAGELAQIGREGGQWHWDSRASLRLDRDQGRASAEIAAEGTHDAAFRPVDIAADTLRITAEDIAVAGAEGAGLDFDGRGRLGAEGLEATGELALHAARVPAGAGDLRDLAARLPLAVSRDGATVQARLTAPGEVSVQAPPAAGPVAVAGPLALDLLSGELRVAGAGIDVRARFDPGTVKAALQRDDAPDVDVSLTPGAVDIAVHRDQGLRAEATVRGAVMDVPGHELEARDIDVDLRHGAADAPLARLRVGALRHAAATPAFAPLALDAVVRREAGDITVSGEARVRETDVAVPFQARHDPAARRTQAAFGPARVHFRPGGLQPAGLTTFLRRISAADGAVTVEGTLAWHPEDGLSSRGALSIEGLSFQTPQARVEGLSGTVAARSLLPPRTPPAQRLTARRVVAAVPLGEVSLRFALDTGASGAPLLRIERAEAHLADGLLSAEDVTLDADPAADNAATIQVAELSLARLLEDLDIEGLSGEGTLSGAVPVRFGPDGVFVDRGKLAARSGGVVRLRSPEAKQALSGQGEQVSLMLQALEDFRYDVLELTVHRPPQSGLELGVVMEGRNPAVLDGYPFRFNISLSGDIEPLIAALQEGRRLSGELLERALQLEQ